ncbi:bifunctional nuclease family protein [candidate division NPL-UPA2 bacterium]|nr:bifunctional nuclease family protein [candidate division NPL-UPA2 bacterium]
MTEMELFQIRVDDRGGEQLIILREKEGNGRLLPIVIGIFEAEAIRIKVKGMKTARPLTHDLLKGAIEQLGATVERIVIDNLEKGTFFAKLMLRTVAGEEVRVDARPSDAIALALRANAPIFVEEEVLSLTAAL